MAKPGFLLMELMIAVVLGLVLISALMRMQVLLLELQDSFCMRDKALIMAVHRFEYGGAENSRVGNSGVSVQAGRDFMINFEQTDKNKPDGFVSKVKVTWRSLVGKNCCLEI